jgi:hypothetical protein
VALDASSVALDASSEALDASSVARDASSWHSMPPPWHSMPPPAILTMMIGWYLLSSSCALRFKIQESRMHHVFRYMHLQI